MSVALEPKAVAQFHKRRGAKREQRFDRVENKMIVGHTVVPQLRKAPRNREFADTWQTVEDDYTHHCRSSSTTSLRREQLFATILISQF